MTYVLIVVTHVYLGNVVTMQEFASEDTCLAAAEVIINSVRGDQMVRVRCVKK